MQLTSQMESVSRNAVQGGEAEYFLRFTFIVNFFFMRLLYSCLSFCSSVLYHTPEGRFSTSRPGQTLDRDEIIMFIGNTLEGLGDVMVECE